MGLHTARFCLRSIFAFSHRLVGRMPFYLSNQGCATTVNNLQYDSDGADYLDSQDRAFLILGLFKR